MRRRAASSYPCLFFPFHHCSLSLPSLSTPSLLSHSLPPFPLSRWATFPAPLHFADYYIPKTRSTKKEANEKIDNRTAFNKVRLGCVGSCFSSFLLLSFFYVSSCLRRVPFVISAPLSCACRRSFSSSSFQTEREKRREKRPALASCFHGKRTHTHIRRRAHFQKALLHPSLSLFLSCTQMGVGGPSLPPSLPPSLFLVDLVTFLVLISHSHTSLSRLQSAAKGFRLPSLRPSLPSSSLLFLSSLVCCCYQ